MSSLKFHIIAIAGTFDQLHKGHRFFISQAFQYGEKIIIGLTSDLFVKNKFPISPSTSLRTSNFQFPMKVGSYKERERELKKFLSKERLLNRAKIIMIHDVYGSAIDNNNIEALVVTKETLSGAYKVNKKRLEKHLPLLKIITIPFINAQDHERISSTRIRNGEIDRWGKVLERVSIKLVPISKQLRMNLKQPVGKLIRGDEQNLGMVKGELKAYIRSVKPAMIITVGDQVTKTAHGISLSPKLSIVDFYVNRQKKYSRLTDFEFKPQILSEIQTGGLQKVINGAGTITKALIISVETAIRNVISNGHAQLICVKGEEDLAALPALLLAPLGSVVLYGQPGEGVVVVEVTEEKKEELVAMIERYT